MTPARAGRSSNGQASGERHLERPIRVAGAVKRYGDTIALDDVSVSVEAGACLALVGESGSGKTTLLRTINRLTRVDGGAVFVRGEPVEALDPVALRRSIGYVQQDSGLIPHWTCLTNASLVPGLLAKPDAERRGRAALAKLGLPPAEFADRYPRELSGGQRQRVAIARAIAADADVLLMDEPFGALDAITRFEAQEALGELRRDAKLTCVLVTHDVAEAIRVATHVAVMRQGRIVAEAPADQLCVRASGYAAELIARSGVRP